MKRLAILSLLLSLTLGGCAKSELSEGDSEKLRQEFSQDNYEAAMKAQGKEQELAEEKARWAAHEAAGGDSQQ